MRFQPPGKIPAPTTLPGHGGPPPCGSARPTFSEAFFVEGSGPIKIRPATARERGFIRFLVLSANLYPLQLDWRRFHVAENGGRILGAGQIRVHSDGAREMASVVVARAYRRKGIGTRLVRRLLDGLQDRVFLCCREDLGPFYAGFGFQRISPESLPNSLGYLYRIEALGSLVLSVVRSTEPDLIAMARDPTLALSG